MEAIPGQNSAPFPHNGEPKQLAQQHDEKESYDQKKLGLVLGPVVQTSPVHSRDLDRTPNDDEEVQYQETLSEEFQNLVFEAQETQSEKLVDREYADGYVEGEEFGYGGGIFDDTRNKYGNDGRCAEVAEGFNNDEVFGRHGSSYPLRPDAEDCQYYMRTGSCKFGSSCKFNHPLRVKNQAQKAAKEKDEYSATRGQIECKYHLRSGGCKYGNACRYKHSREKTSATPVVQFNFLGLPIRPGEKECPFYMRIGSCKYGSTCKFNHPEPTSAKGDAPSGFGNGATVPLQAMSQTPMSSWSSPRSLNGAVPMLPVVFSPTSGFPSPDLEWNSYQAPVYPAPEGRLPTPPAFSLTNPAESNFYTHHKLLVLFSEYPERPGEPECSYFLKTGDCKFRSGCKFHHPKNRMTKATPCALSDKGLPLRPGQKACSYYNQYGICKYGPACRFDHSVQYNSASSTLSGQSGTPFFGNSGLTDAEEKSLMPQNA